MQVVSQVTGLEYEASDMVYIVNPLQTARYIKHGAILYDVFESRDSLIFVFSRIETKEMYNLWCKRELV